jgi:hypothetical protein
VRRLIFLTAFLFVIGGGTAIAYQGDSASTPEVGNAVTDESACATPETQSAESSPAVADAAEDLMATPEASPGVVGVCATPAT